MQAAKSRTKLPMNRLELEQMQHHAGEAAALLRALSNESRLLILCTLAGNEMSVSELNERIPLSQSALSQQLAVLRREGLVETRREAQTIIYSLAPSNALAVIDVLYKLYCESGEAETVDRARRRAGSGKRRGASTRRSIR